MLAAILTICGTMTMGLTSCSDVDNPVTNTGITEADMKQASIGLRLDLTDIVLGTDRVRIWDFKEDNKFVAYDLYTDDEENFAVEQLSGTWKPFVNQNLAWDIDENIQASGIKVIFDDENGGPGNAAGEETYFGFNIPDENNKVEDADLYFLSQYALSYLAYNESVSEHPELYEADENDVDNVGDDFDPYLARTRAAPASDFAPTKNETVKLLGNVSNNVTLTQQALTTKEGQQQLHQTVMNTISNQTKGTVNNNPNDATFNLKTWRDQETILLWDGQKNITVQLPWSSQVTNNNLPMNFCNDIRPDTGWDLVMNYCGEQVQTIGSSGYHFFALYNKYSGILRFFTYIPENFSANNANDHAWEVTMGEQTAQHLGFRYGLPMDKTVVNRAAIGMNSSDYNVYCSPWVGSRSKDGFITPNAGWWAFDVDLSNYRPGYTAALERLRLQMRAWANSNVTFSSVLSAKVQRESYSTAYNCNSLSGVVSMLTDVGGTVAQLATGISDGKWGNAVKAGFGLLGKGYGVFTSIRDKDTAKPKYSVVNTIDGTIDTKGLISGTVNVGRVTSPDMPMARFDTKNTTLGQGVWNIKSSPVVYQLDAQYYFNTRMEDGSLIRPSLSVIDKKFRNKFRGSPCLFDPSSVEVVLNPNVFPKSDIEYVDVKTFCAVRNKTKHDMGSEYRKAFNLPVYNQYTLSKEQVYVSDYKMNSNNPAWDYLYDCSDKMDMTYPKVYKDIETDNKVGYALVGRGNDESLMEPTMFGYDESTWGQDIKPYLPFYEVTVMVTVKLKSLNAPLSYTRTYLPEVRWLSWNKAVGVVSHAEKWLADLKKEGLANKESGTAYQEYQLKHMKDVLSFVKPGYETALHGVTFTEVKGGGDYIRNLFDGNLNTAWEPSIKARVNGSYWECEFKSSRPINVKSYTLYNHNNWNKYKSEPELWSISAKNEKGEWIEIDSRYKEQPKGNSASKTYEVKIPGSYQEFRFRVVCYNGSLSGWANFWGADLRLRVAELVFHE
jgi:hypothetical protein